MEVTRIGNGYIQIPYDCPFGFALAKEEDFEKFRSGDNSPLSLIVPTGFISMGDNSLKTESEHIKEISVEYNCNNIGGPHITEMAKKMMNHYSLKFSEKNNDSSPEEQYNEMMMDIYGSSENYYRKAIEWWSTGINSDGYYHHTDLKLRDVLNEWSNYINPQFQTCEEIPKLKDIISDEVRDKLQKFHPMSYTLRTRGRYIDESDRF